MRWFLSRITRHIDKIDEALGIIAIFALMIAGFWIAYGFGYPTGGTELLSI